MRGIDVDLLNIIQDKLGFTYEFKFERVWADIAPNGTLYPSMYYSVAVEDSHIGLGHTTPDRGGKILLSMNKGKN